MTNLTNIKKIIYLFIPLIGLTGCSGLEDAKREKIRQANASGQRIYRSHDERFFEVMEPVRRVRENYAWEDTFVGTHVRITKEFFRCGGSTESPAITKTAGGDVSRIVDCGGIQQHSLPIKEGKEFIYPALIDLLNYVQEKTQKKVVITCGHRCPAHNTYSDGSKYNQTSKHMIGAEVDFYVKGLEWSPERVIDVLNQYYAEHSIFREDPQFTKFSRFEAETDVTTLPWYNKEIFIKLYKKDEGRDLDNTHRFPYISIQLKWDRESKERVAYTWSKAFNGYLRY